MTWFKIDDSFYDHPKVFDAPDCAVALWVRAGTWSARNLTDGFVPAGMPARLCDDPDTAIRELIRRGLWSRAKDGYRFHDWADYQPTREAKEREREAAAERQRKRRAHLKGQVNGTPVTEVSRRDSRVSRGVSHGVSSPAPTRPDPTTQVPSEPAALPARQPTITQRSKAITDAYAAAEPMCKWPAVNAIVIKAIKSERFTDDEIRDGLLRLAGEGRGVTVETLRVELSGLPANARAVRPSTTDQRVAQAAALVAQLEAGQALEIPR